MLVRSAKNKGQRAAKEVRAVLMEAFPILGENDIMVTPSGVSGADLIFSPKAQDEIGDYDVEVKNCERFSIWEALDQVKRRCNLKTPLLVFRRNRESLHVCLRVEDFVTVLNQRTATCKTNVL